MDTRGPVPAVNVSCSLHGNWPAVDRFVRIGLALHNTASPMRGLILAVDIWTFGVRGVRRILHHLK